jgi:predicted transcriptional regulator
MENKNLIGYCLDLDMELFEFLRSHGSDRFTKLDAFCDLINRLPVTKMGEEYDSLKKLLPYESDTFRATITELAQSWHWHRATVRTFLDGLEKLGYLTKELDGKEYIFKIKMVSNVVIPISMQDIMRTTMMVIIEKYFNSDMTDEQIAEAFEKNTQETLKKMESATEENSDEIVAEMKTQFVQQAISTLTFHYGHILSQEDDVFSLVSSACSGETPWSWLKWIKALRYLNVNGYGVMPGEGDAKHYVTNDAIELTDFSEEDRRIINSLADFIGGLSETAGNAPEESQEDNAEQSSSPAIPVQE